MIRALILLALLALAGCISIDQARDAAVQADHRLDQAEQAVVAAEHALLAAQVIAEQTGSEQAEQAVSAAQRAVDYAKAALPAARDAAAIAAESMEAAVAARDAGWQVGDWIAALLGAAVPAAGGIYAAVKGRRWKEVAEHGLQLAQDLKRRAQAANVPIDDRLKEAAAWQKAKGVQAQVDVLRRPSK